MNLLVATHIPQTPHYWHKWKKLILTLKEFHKYFSQTTVTKPLHSQTPKEQWKKNNENKLSLHEYNTLVEHFHTELIELIIHDTWN